MRCKYDRVLSVIREQFHRELRKDEVFIILSKDRRKVRLFNYDRRSAALFEKRFSAGYRFMRVEKEGGETCQDKMDTSLYKSWLVVPYQRSNGEVINRDTGVPQGSVIGPILANLFLHYAFDKWMSCKYPYIPFERYADDCICHCNSLSQAEYMKRKLVERFAECKLQLNMEKTKIVFCKLSSRSSENYQSTSFDYLGFTFRPRAAKDRRHNVLFTSFLPAISKKSVRRIHDTIKSWNLKRLHNRSLRFLATYINNVVRGWINYYEKFGKTEFWKVMYHLNRSIAHWAKGKYKRFRR